MADFERPREGHSAFAALYGFVPAQPVATAAGDWHSLHKAYAEAQRTEEDAYEALTAARKQMPQLEDESQLDPQLLMRWVQASAAVTGAWERLHRHTLGDGRDVRTNV